MISGTSRNAFRVHANFPVFLSRFRLLLALHTARFLISFFHLAFPSVVFCCRCTSTFVANVVYSPHFSDPIALPSPIHLIYLILYRQCAGIVGRHPGMRDRATEDLEAVYTKYLAEAAALTTTNASSGEFESGIPRLNTQKNVRRGGIW
jgi:hypothetical protein